MFTDLYMITEEGLPFINEYVDSLNKILKTKNKQLSKIQSTWLGFIVWCIITTNTVCWARFERFSFKKYTIGAISWMFKKSKIPWDRLLFASAKSIIDKYKIKSGHLVIDDLDRARSKKTTKIAKVHKIKDKLTSGYINGQNVVLLMLVSKEATIPVGYKIYEPDPKLTAYSKEDKKLKKKGVAKKYRPQEPERSKNYPTKIMLALEMVKKFVAEFPDIKIMSTSADAAYGTREFVTQIEKFTKQKQVITQIKNNQIIQVHKHNKTMQVTEFFKYYHGVAQTVKLRGQDKTITYVSCKLKVKSHNAIYRVIALKYDNEDTYRYIIANDSSWQSIDILQAYALRWLVEVFIQDWKSYEGWTQLAKQPGVDGSIRGIVLSLLCDHALLTHQEQIALFKRGEPACTVGSLREKVVMDSLLAFIHSIIYSDNPKSLFDKHKDNITQIFELRASKKHMRYMIDEEQQAKNMNLDNENTKMAS